MLLKACTSARSVWSAAPGCLALCGRDWSASWLQHADIRMLQPAVGMSCRHEAHASWHACCCFLCPKQRCMGVWPCVHSHAVRHWPAPLACRQATGACCPCRSPCREPSQQGTRQDWLPTHLRCLAARSPSVDHSQKSWLRRGARLEPAQRQGRSAQRQAFTRQHAAQADRPLPACSRAFECPMHADSGETLNLNPSTSEQQPKFGAMHASALQHKGLCDWPAKNHDSPCCSMRGDDFACDGSPD